MTLLSTVTKQQLRTHWPINNGYSLSTAIAQTSLQCNTTDTQLNLY